MENNTLFVQHYWYKSDSSPLGRRTAPSSPNHMSPLGFLLLFSFHNLFCLCVLLCYVSGVKDMCYPKEGRDDPAMVSCQGVSRVERERKRVGLIDGWCGSECHGVVINNCQFQSMHTSPMCEEQSHVHQSRCVLVSSINFLVLMCPARCGHCSRHSESGMALRMMMLQSSHLTHAWSSTTLCVISHHASTTPFFHLFKPGKTLWNSMFVHLYLILLSNCGISYHCLWVVSLLLYMKND